jgi:hypothetical protein
MKPNCSEGNVLIIPEHKLKHKTRLITLARFFGRFEGGIGERSVRRLFNFALEDVGRVL